MKPKAKKPEPAKVPSVVAWCPKCGSKRYALGGVCLSCGGKVSQ